MRKREMDGINGGLYNSHGIAIVHMIKINGH
jgi:hypothetical protein